MKAIMDVYRNCLSFDGRSGVREYLYYGIFYVFCVIVIVLLESGSGIRNGEIEVGFFLTLFIILNALPNLSLTIRRLHDGDFSGSWFLLSLIPIVGPLILLMLVFQPGSPGDNRFGPALHKANSAEESPQTGSE